MKNEIIPIKRDIIDDDIIRLVNENHARAVRAQQIKAARRQKAIDDLCDDIFHFVAGACAAALLFAFLLL